MRQLIFLKVNAEFQVHQIASKLNHPTLTKLKLFLASCSKKVAFLE